MVLIIYVKTTNQYAGIKIKHVIKPPLIFELLNLQRNEEQYATTLASMSFSRKCSINSDLSVMLFSRRS